RLARAHLARDQDEAAPLAPPELEVGERLLVTAREVEVLRVGGEVEGLLAEAVERFVHQNWMRPWSTKAAIAVRSSSLRRVSLTPLRGRAALSSGRTTDPTAWMALAR